MYQLINKKRNVSEYLLINNNLIISTGNNLLLENEIVFSAKETYISNIKKCNQTVYILEYKVGLTYFNIENPNNKKTKDFIKGISLIINENDIIYGFYSNDYTTQYRCRINLETNEKKWTIESYFGNGKIADNFLYASCLNNKICKIDLNHPEKPLWQFDLSQFGTFSYGGDELPYKVVHFVGIWKNNLLVQLTNNRLIAIDTNTGKLVNDTQNRLNIPAVYKNTLVKMHLQGDMLHWLATFAYIQIHLNNFQVELKKDFTSTPENQRLEFSHNTLYDDKLYFVAGSQGSSIFKTHTGVFDILKNEVVWSNNPKEQLQKGEILKNEAPKVTDNKLYVPGNKGTLLIFEKTTDEQV